MHLTVEDGVITKCKFTGGCPFNMSVFAENLVGERIDSAASLVRTNCCSRSNKSCRDKLYPVLEQWFKKLQVDYETEFRQRGL